MEFDIIGDIHGDASKLRDLLKTLGYHMSGATWGHERRKAVFLGDFIDRGPDQLEICDTVRNMIASGSAFAVMGNHEFNAIAWFLEDPDNPSQHLRRHTEKNREQHAAFLAEVESTPRHREMIDWFLTLPLWLELDGIRVVHACWHGEYMSELEPYLEPGHRLGKSMVKAASRPGTMAFRNVEYLLKGPEMKLPDGHTFLDKGGHVRDRARVRWWDDSATTLRQMTLPDDSRYGGLPDVLVPGIVLPGYRDPEPVFIGHYSLPGRPALLAPKVACVDYFCTDDNPLVAYRWDGGNVLHSDRFVVV